MIRLLGPPPVAVGPTGPESCISRKKTLTGAEPGGFLQLDRDCENPIIITGVEDLYPSAAHKEGLPLAMTRARNDGVAV